MTRIHARTKEVRPLRGKIRPEISCSCRSHKGLVLLMVEDLPPGAVQVNDMQAVSWGHI